MDQGQQCDRLGSAYLCGLADMLYQSDKSPDQYYSNDDGHHETLNFLPVHMHAKNNTAVRWSSILQQQPVGVRAGLLHLGVPVYAIASPRIGWSPQPHRGDLPDIPQACPST